MDPDGISPNSPEDDRYIEGSACKKQKSNDEETDIQISNSKTSSQNNDQSLHNHDETVQSSEDTMKPRSKVEDKSLNVPESEPSVSTIAEDSASNISVLANNDNSKSSQDMPSFTNAESTCSSSLSNNTASENKLVNNFQLSSYLTFLDLFNRNIENMINSSPDIPFSCLGLGNEFPPKDYKVTGYRQNDCHNDDKFNRREVNKESTSFSKTDHLPTASVSSRSLQDTSPEENDWDIYESHSRSNEVKYSTKMAYDILSFCNKIKYADVSPQWDSKRLLKEVQIFFENNTVVADEDLSWDEMKHRIVTSKYFSDDFSLEISFEKMLNDHERPFRKLKELLELKWLCKALRKDGIPEKEYIQFMEACLRYEGGGNPILSVIELFKHHQDTDYSLMDTYEKSVGFFIMLELYNKLTKEGFSYEKILQIPEEP